VASSVEDLELTVRRLVQRVSALEAQIAKAKTTPSVWLSPDAAAKISGGKYTAYLIRSRVDMSIASPSSTNLQQGIHYMKTCRSDGNYRYQVYWPEFDAVLHG
jgi:hypothetical protein